MKQILKNYGGRFFNWFILNSGMAENPEEASERFLMVTSIGMLLNMISLYVFADQFMQILLTATLGILFLCLFFFMLATSILTAPVGQKYREELLSDTEQATLPSFND